jgi:rhodanese-related sulfurtransferase
MGAFMRIINLVFSIFLGVIPAFANEQAGAVHAKQIHVAELKAMLANTGTAPHIFDANTAKTRIKDGLIPGAHPLSSSSDYDIKTELPADKGAILVFYCYNPSCGASHTAAKRALDAGFTDVSVMVDGIVGWEQSGGATEKPKA